MITRFRSTTFDYSSHVEALESNVNQLESELREARRQAIAVEDKDGGQDPYEAISARLADLVRMFDQDGATLRGAALTQAPRLDRAPRTQEEGRFPGYLGPMS